MNFTSEHKFGYLKETLADKNGLRAGDVIFVDKSYGNYINAINLSEEYERITAIPRSKIDFIQEVVLDADYYIENNIYPFITFGSLNKSINVIDKEEDFVPLIITKSYDETNTGFFALDPFSPTNILTIRREKLRNHSELYGSFYLFEINDDSKPLNKYNKNVWKYDKVLLLAKPKAESIIQQTNEEDIEETKEDREKIAQLIWDILEIEIDPDMNFPTIGTLDRRPSWTCFSLNKLLNHPCYGADITFTNERYIPAALGGDKLIFAGNI